MGRSWMEEYDRKDDERRERYLNDRLEYCLERWEDVLKNSHYDRKAEIRALKDVIEAYKNLKIEAFDYNEEDFNKKEAKLCILQSKEMEEQYKTDTMEEYEYEEDDRGER